jgi:membrane peptidoglycan carboxypeptidase
MDKRTPTRREPEPSSDHWSDRAGGWVALAVAGILEIARAGVRGLRRLAGTLGRQGVDSARWARPWLGRATSDARRDLARAGRWTGRSSSALASGLRPLGAGLVAGGRRLGRQAGPRGRAPAGALGRGLTRAGAALLGATRGRRTVLTRVAVVLFALGLAGWFLPGPVLGTAANFAEVDDPPFPPLADRSVVVAADGTPLGTVHDGENRRVVPLDEVPPLVQELVAVAEDRRFYDHEGYDQSGMARAALANLQARGVDQGGSTITQQLVKQNLVGSDRTPVRKLRELVLSVAVERKVSKQDLLARYLNQVYFGAGAYGIAAASETYFGTDPAGLRPEQAALLAALIREPGLDAWSEPGTVRARRDQVLEAAAEQGVLEPGAGEELRRRDLGLLPAPLGPEILDRDLVAAVERELAATPELGPDPEARLERFRTGGWTVETTIEPAAQGAAQRAVAAYLTEVDGRGAAVASVEPGTGRITALHSVRPPELAHLNLASDGRRQPGSAFKPLAAVAALEAGLDPDEKLEGRSGAEFDLGAEDWEVDNFDDTDHRKVDLAVALRDSVNTAFAQLGAAVGAERLAEVVERVGIDRDATLGPPSEWGPAIALGGVHQGVSPLEMAAAYATMANDGAYVAPTMIERVVDGDGNVVLARTPEPRPAIDPVVNGNVRSMLEAVVSEGTGTAARLSGRDAFGKTGTSQDRADAWFVGATPELSAAVWVGHPLGRTPMPAATGGTVAAPMWKVLMSGALQGRDPSSFPDARPLRSRGSLDLPDADT